MATEGKMKKTWKVPGEVPLQKGEVVDIHKQMFKQKHPYAQGHEFHSGGHNRDAAISKAKEMRNNGDFATIWHIGGPKTGAKSNYAIATNSKLKKTSDSADELSGKFGHMLKCMRSEKMNKARVDDNMAPNQKRMMREDRRIEGAAPMGVHTPKVPGIKQPSSVHLEKLTQLKTMPKPKLPK